MDATTPEDPPQIRRVFRIPPDSRAFRNEEDKQKYKTLKNRMASGEEIPRDDFLFVKNIDQRHNAMRRRDCINWRSAMSHGPNANAQFNTKKK